MRGRERMGGCKTILTVLARTAILLFAGIGEAKYMTQVDMVEFKASNMLTLSSASIFRSNLGHTQLSGTTK